MWILSPSQPMPPVTTRRQFPASRSTKRLSTRLRLNIKNKKKALLLKFPFKDERE